MSSAPAACQDPGTSSWPGLTLSGGNVAGAAILDEIDGFAKIAGATGGLGGPLAVVTSTGDYDSDAGDPEIRGSLRYIVGRAALLNTPVWVVFSPNLPRPAIITLKKPLDIGNNATIDGSCADITIQGISDSGLFYVLNKRNVIIDRLRLTNIVSDLPLPVLGSAIRLGGDFDAVAIIHNEMTQCGDKCIATTSSVGQPVPGQARLTVAFNYIHDHDKTILFGTYNCQNGDDCTAQEAVENGILGPGLFMTMEGNVLLRDAQRNPRVFGRAMLHAFDNYIAFQPYIRPSGQASAAYGIMVSNGAQALIEHNLFIPLDPHKLDAVFTNGTPGTTTPPGDHAGFIRLQGGPQGAPGVVIGQNDPQNVITPYYAYNAIPLEQLSPDQALACLASRAGRAGAANWGSAACAAN